ncbi:MAG: M3 family oligoendopeptidase [Candidatus Andersenbacteria bacterium]
MASSKRPKQPPRWDLSDLYAHIADPAVVRDQARIEKQLKRFLATYRNAITKDVTTKTLAALLQDYSNIIAGVRKLVAYARLEFSTHTRDDKHGAFLQNISTWSTAVDTQLLFVDLQISRLPKKVLARFADDQGLQDSHHYLDIQVAWRPHRLSEREEKILYDKSLTGLWALQRIYDLDHVEREYVVTVGKKTEHMHDAHVLSLLHSPKPERRKAAAEAVGKRNEESIKQSALLYNTVVYDYIMNAKYRNFERPEDMRHLENEVTREAVEALLSEVRASRPIVHKHYKLKKKLLDLPTLHEYDKYAPMNATAKTYTWEQARELVVSSFRNFSEEFGAIAEEFFDKGWIDGPPQKGKRSGAFCYFVTPDLHPYVLMNFKGTTNDVMTLAHELGHGIHAYLARKQSLLHFDWPLTTAETASIFGEMIVFDQLLEQLPPKQKLTLVMHKLESIFASAHRQIAMFEFERAVFDIRKEREVSVEEFKKLWVKGQKDLFGSGVKISKNEEHWWSMIPHLVHYPFYVYAYAFGELLTLSLYTMYKNEGDVFVKKYMEFLAAGGSKSPDDLLRAFDIDWSQQSFWKQGVQEIEQLVQTAQELTK